MKICLYSVNDFPVVQELSAMLARGCDQADLIRLAERVEKALARVRTPLKVAVMGCVVNGPGEAKEADVGIAGGKGKGILFKHGKKVASCPESELLPALLAEIAQMTGEGAAISKKSLFV